MKKNKKNLFNNYDAIIFDFDGTIVDLDIDWKSAKKELFKFLKSINSDLFSLLNKKKIGKSEIINVYIKQYGKAFKDNVSKLSRNVEKNFLESWSEKDGASGNINKFKHANTKLFIWTLNTKPVINKVLKSLNINRNIFTEIISFESGLYIKPDITYLTKILKKYNIKKPIYIGDSYYDVVASKKAKIKYLNFSRMHELFAKFND